MINGIDLSPLIEAKEWGYVILILTALGVVRDIIQRNKYDVKIKDLNSKRLIYTKELEKKYSQGSCKGEVHKCKFSIAVAQSNMIRARYANLITGIHKSFSDALAERALIDNNITHAQILDAKTVHNHLLWYSFMPAIEETKRLLRENGIPRDAKAFEDYAEEKNNHINAIVWERFRSGYLDGVMILTLEEREEAQKQMQTAYKEFARGIIITGVEIAEKGGA